MLNPYLTRTKPIFNPYIPVLNPYFSTGLEHLETLGFSIDPTIYRIWVRRAVFHTCFTCALSVGCPGFGGSGWESGTEDRHDMWEGMLLVVGEWFGPIISFVGTQYDGSYVTDHVTAHDTLR